MPKRQSIIQCPGCGSCNFRIEGLVGYKQDYGSRSEHWSSSDIQWDVDYPQRAECRECKTDATGLLARKGVLAEFYGDPPEVQQRRGKQMYVVDFELTSGQYGQPFSHVFEASGSKDLERQVEKYLKNYYQGGNRREGRTWYYCEDEISVKLHGWKAFSDPAEVIRKLRA